jgi:hypothetical protein
LTAVRDKVAKGAVRGCVRAGDALDRSQQNGDARGCDLVALRIDDMTPHGYAIDRANLLQRKTGLPVRFELTRQTAGRYAYVRSTGCKPGQVLFPGRGGSSWLERYFRGNQERRAFHLSSFKATLTR